MIGEPHSPITQAGYDEAERKALYPADVCHEELKRQAEHKRLLDTEPAFRKEVLDTFEMLERKLDVSYTPAISELRFRFLP